MVWRGFRKRPVISDTLLSYTSTGISRGSLAKAAAGPPRGPDRGSACRPLFEREGGGLCPVERFAPLAIIGSQTLAAGTDPVLVAAALERLGIPVYLSGMARGLLGRDHPVQVAPSAQASVEGGRLRHSRGRAVRFPPRLWPANPPVSHADRGEPQPQGRAAEPPPGHRSHRRRRPVS